MIFIFGYGIQGRAHALNLRDSGAMVTIVNRVDEYYKLAQQDNFLVISQLSPNDISDNDILYILLPEEVHFPVLKDLFVKLSKKVTIIFAHGYTLANKQMHFPENSNLIMIAPRFPGQQVREYFVNGSGVPAYVSVYKDVYGKAKLILDNICNSLGFTKGGLLHVTPEQETLVDLAIENIMAPSFFIFVQKLFESLVKRGIPPEVACMELYYSGETGAVRTSMSKHGLYEGLQKNASPTCQFGVSSSSEALSKEKWIDEFIETRLTRIERGEFSRELENKDLAFNKRDIFFSSEISYRIREAEQKCNNIFKK